MNTKTTNCLQCGEPSAKRGLCGTCYSRFDKAKTRLSKDKKASFERALIESGKLLPKGKRSSKSYDPYGELADQLQEADDQQVGEIIEEFRTKNKKSQKPTVQQEADDVARKAKKAAKRKGITPKDKSE